MNNFFNWIEKKNRLFDKTIDWILRQLSINSWRVFETNTKNKREIILNIFWSSAMSFQERKAPFLSSDQDHSNSFIKNCFLNFARALNWLRLFHHWSDHQTKPSIPFLHYFCNILYRSACIVVCDTYLSLYWILFCCELPDVVILCVKGVLYSL